MNFDLYNDISTLTTAQPASIERLIDISSDAICSYLLETIRNGESVCSIDIGFGELNILYADDELRYKFVPNQALEKKLVDSVTSNKDPLVSRIESTLKERILGTRKELL